MHTPVIRRHENLLFLFRLFDLHALVHGHSKTQADAGGVWNTGVLADPLRAVCVADFSPERCVLLLSCSLLALRLADCRLATTRVH